MQEVDRMSGHAEAADDEDVTRADQGSGLAGRDLRNRLQSLAPMILADSEASTASGLAVLAEATLRHPSANTQAVRTCADLGRLRDLSDPRNRPRGNRGHGQTCMRAGSPSLSPS